MVFLCYLFVELLPECSFVELWSVRSSSCGEFFRRAACRTFVELRRVRSPSCCQTFVELLSGVFFRRAAVGVFFGRAAVRDKKQSKE